ncbi:MAG: hypothetical protein ACKOCD_07590 [Nitrospiraceae bacterium]
MSHFLFIAGALHERSSQVSADVQIAHELWGLRTALIRDNLRTYLSNGSCGLVYVLKQGLCAGFAIRSHVLPPEDLGEFVRDELREETRYGFVRVQPAQSWQSTPEASLALLQSVLDVPDQAELTRRLNLGMHRLTQEQYDAILAELG